MPTEVLTGLVFTSLRLLVLSLPSHVIFLSSSPGIAMRPHLQEPNSRLHDSKTCFWGLTSRRMSFMPLLFNYYVNGMNKLMHKGTMRAQ